MTREQLREFAMSPFATLEQIIELQRMDLTATHEIEERQLAVLSKAELIEERDRTRNALIRHLRISIYGKKHPEKEIIRYPSDWWQAVKQRFAPAWFLKRYPVQFSTVTAILEELYPEVKPSLPSKNPVWHLQVRREPSPGETYRA